MRQFHLKETNPSDGHPFIRAEMSRRLHGAVTLEERNLRRGNYYHFRWHGLSGPGLVKVIFEYRQARTGATVKKVLVTAERTRNGSGDLEIAIKGREYLRDGHVQSWRARLFKGEKLVETQKSYLWD